MTEMSTDWIEGLVKPLLVKPGSTVRLAKDFDPGYTGGVRKKDEGLTRLRHGVQLLADYQDRLSAQNTYGPVGMAGARRTGRGDAR
jgi:hypothetical protein